jgi:hypothetical protein
MTPSGIETVTFPLWRNSLTNFATACQNDSESILFCLEGIPVIASVYFVA